MNLTFSEMKLRLAPGFSSFFKSCMKIPESEDRGKAGYKVF